MTPTTSEPAMPPVAAPESPRLDRETLVGYLKNVSILKSLDAEAIDCLEDVEQIHRPAGAIIARQGETAQHFWILLDGNLRVSNKRSDGMEMTMATMPAGTAFGELPLLANIQYPTTISATEPCILLRLTEDEFWHLMTECPEVRKAILGNMAMRLQKTQNTTIQQEKMASLGTLAAGLMHELNNPGAAARRASTQLRENLIRLQELAAKFTRIDLNQAQKQCMLDLQTHVLQAKPLELNSLEQSDAEEALAEWMETSRIENAWKIAPTLVTVGIDSHELSCARENFDGTIFSDALNWLDALVSSMQLVGTIEESIGRVHTLVSAVKSYAYEGKGPQKINVNESIYATLVILGHKMREKQIILEKQIQKDLPLLESACSGLNQVWTNIIDNAIDALPEHGHIRIKTWSEADTESPDNSFLCVTIEDDGPGIPLDSQPHIFDPFYTTKPVGIGTGLGLGIVYKIIESFGGTIRFTSGPGSTLFRVRLPAHNPNPPVPPNL